MLNINFHRPKKKDELTAILRGMIQQKESFTFYAGGTDLSPGLKLQKNPPKHVIFLSQLEGLEELQQITLPSASCSGSVLRDTRSSALLRLLDPGVLYIGAMCTLEHIGTHPLILSKLGIVASTAQKIASPQIRNKATIGGNILVDNRCLFFNQSKFVQEVHGPCFKASGGVCHLIPSAKPGDERLCRARSVSDLVPVLILLNATLHVDGPKGARQILMREFYAQDGISRHNLLNEEFLTHLEVPLNLNGHLSYHKLRIRQAIDFPSVGVAVGLFEESVKICVTGIDTHPHYWSYDKKDFPSLEELSKKAIAVANKEISILKQDFFPPGHRKKMIGVYIRQSLGPGK